MPKDYPDAAAAAVEEIEKAGDVEGLRDDAEVVHGLKRRLSTASVLDDEEAEPTADVDGRAMYVREIGYGAGGKTWPQKAKEAGLPIRNHISSGLPLDLAVCEGLLEISPREAWSPENTNRMRQLATAMFLTHYHRADYHSWPETQAAIEYFTEIRSKAFFENLAAEEVLETSTPESLIKSTVIRHSFPKEWNPSTLMARAEMSLPDVVDSVRIRAEIQRKIDQGRERRAQLISPQVAIAGAGSSARLALERGRVPPPDHLSDIRTST